jgi:hypothetical protein
MHDAFGTEVYVTVTRLAPARYEGAQAAGYKSNNWCTVPPTTLLLKLHARGLSAFLIGGHFLKQQQLLHFANNKPVLHRAMHRAYEQACNTMLSMLLVTIIQAFQCSQHKPWHANPWLTLVLLRGFTVSVMP